MLHPPAVVCATVSVCVTHPCIVCSIRMLDPDMWEQYDHYKLAYSNILYNWRLFNQRAVILKFISTTLPQHKGVGKFIDVMIYHHDFRPAGG